MFEQMVPGYVKMIALDIACVNIVVITHSKKLKTHSKCVFVCYVILIKDNKITHANKLKYTLKRRLVFYDIAEE